MTLYGQAGEDGDDKCFVFEVLNVGVTVFPYNCTAVNNSQSSSALSSTSTVTEALLVQEFLKKRHAITAM